MSFEAMGKSGRNVRRRTNITSSYRRGGRKGEIMYIDLSGEWKISLTADEGRQSGVIMLPGILQAAGYGNPITRQTPWVSSLHDSFWYEQEEYQYAQEEGVNVPFLSQPPRHFLGQAVYERTFVVPGDGQPTEKRYAEIGQVAKSVQAAEESAEGQEWYFHVEAARWRSQVWIDGELRGEDCSLCAPHEIRVGKLACGEHTLRVVMDNSMQYPYRPDAHGVSDALGATWNGMVGEIALYTEKVEKEREKERKEYAKAHPRTVESKDGRFWIDGKPYYFRATHFGGEYPLTGYPVVDKEWWSKRMRVIKEWGLNGIRFHSYCPPEAAFAAADEEGVCLLVECGMWNHFEEAPAGEVMNEVLREETRRILKHFGHHPSFVFFSPSNEPSGPWFGPLKRWVRETREYDKTLGYEGRRIYTAQSGWPYEVPPAEVEGTDFIYFHRSGHNFRKGGMIRGAVGWKGKDFSCVLPGAKLPVVCHELGQICAYPDYAVIEKFTGFMQPGNYKVFRENARANGILPYADAFVKCSGENQIRLYKEELEANFRTPEIQGFELLDLHDYLGQGTALVGILDAFWESKGYGSPEEFRNFCGDTVLLARCSSYVWKDTDTAEIPVEVCHYGQEPIENAVIRWSVKEKDREIFSGEFPVERIPQGGNTKVGSITLSFGEIQHKNREFTLVLELSTDSEKSDKRFHNTISHNSWPLYLFSRPEEEIPDQSESVLYTRDWQEAREALEAGKRVVYSPWLSDLNYECPPLSGASVGWNSQMGPTWCRTMGVVVEEGHPIFRDFPTGRSGGWQWEDILKNSRGFHMEGLEHIKPIVQPIDDWNRNLLQGLIFEARVCNGRLLLVSANLEGEFEKRPGAYCLKQAILRYAASDQFLPEGYPESPVVQLQEIENKLFPMLRMEELVKEISYGSLGEEGRVKNGMAIVEADPSTSVRVEKEDFPIVITMTLHRPIRMEGFLYVPEQRDRDHEGFAEEYRLEVRNNALGCWETAAEGTFRNTCRSQRILFDKERVSDTIRLTILSAYGCVDREVWAASARGWERVFQPKTAILQMAGFHLLCEEEAPHRDVFTSGREQRSRTKEIEL